MVGAIIELFRVLTNLLYTISQSELNTKSTVTPYLFGTAIMIFGLYKVAIFPGLWNVPFILTLSSFSTLILMTINMRKLLSIDFPFKKIIYSACLLSPLYFLNFLRIEKEILNSIIVLALCFIYLIVILHLILKKEFDSLV